MANCKMVSVQKARLRDSGDEEPLPANPMVDDESADDSIKQEPPLDTDEEMHVDALTVRRKKTPLQTPSRLEITRGL